MSNGGDFKKGAGQGAGMAVGCIGVLIGAFVLLLIVGACISIVGA